MRPSTNGSVRGARNHRFSTEPIHASSPGNKLCRSFSLCSAPLVLFAIENSFTQQFIGGAGKARLAGPTFTLQQPMARALARDDLIISIVEKTINVEDSVGRIPYMSLGAFLNFYFATKRRLSP